MEAQPRAARVVLVTLVMALLAFGASLVLLAGPAEAQTEPYSTATPTVLPTVITKVDEPTAGEEPEIQGKGILPFTGADLTLFVVTGVAVIGTGMFIVRRTRSRAHRDGTL